jgi:hypothetical protein
MPRGRPRKNPAEQGQAVVKRGPGRPRKTPADSSDSVLYRSAEFIGWALGGIEREIVDTKSRLTALTEKAGQLRARLGLAGAGTPTSQTRGATGGAGEGAPAVAAETGGGRRRRRRKLTPEQRAAISERMRRTWAERRKGR